MNNSQAVAERMQFAQWLKTSHPEIYRSAVATADTEATLSGLGEEAPPSESWWSKFLKGAAAAGATYLGLKAQRDQLKLNIARAQQGQPPIDVVGQPVLETKVSLAPDVTEKIVESAGRNVNKVLLFGGLGLLAFLLLR